MHSPWKRAINCLSKKDRYPVLDDYKAKIAKYILSEIVNIDFASDGTPQIINKWVENKTNKKIKELFLQGAMSSDTFAVLINAIYFKSTWDAEFDKKETHESKCSRARQNFKMFCTGNALQEKQTQYGYFHA